MSASISNFGPMPTGSALAERMEATRLPGAAAGPRGFQDVLLDALSETNRLEGESQAAIAEGLTGGDLTNAEVMASARKADLALRMMIQVRNKLVDAYREVQQMRM
jgi:flagellar hook-basal body complex protein FliE